MASRFQNRLVGSIILVSLGVIILPDVLDGKKIHYKEELAAIPIKPPVSEELETFELQEPETADSELPPSAEELVKTTTDETTEVKSESVKEDSAQFVDSAWIIQLMALKNHDNAVKLVSDLQKRGYQAHTKRENGFTRVIIGPDVSKDKMERQRVELAKITGANGQLIKFKPLNP